MGRVIEIFLLLQISITTVSVISEQIFTSHYRYRLRDSDESSRFPSRNELERRSGIPIADEAEGSISASEGSGIIVNLRPIYNKETKRNLRFSPRKQRVELEDEDNPVVESYNDEFSSEESNDHIQIGDLNSDMSKPRARFLWPFQLTVSKTKEGKYKESHKPTGPPPEFKQPEPVPFHSFDPDLDPEIQKLRIELYKGYRRWKKWKKINKHEYTELAALGLTGMITYLEFI